MKFIKIMKNNSKNTKVDKEEKERKKREELEAKNKQKDEQYKKLEDYVNETGLSLAFNIIFAELISKQIMPENFFTYTSMRLKQIGKEIEGLKTKETITSEKNEEGENKKEENWDENNENGQKLFEGNNKEEEDVLLTVQKTKNKI